MSSFHQALSEAVARAARERSEQERETQPRTVCQPYVPARSLEANRKL